MGSLQCGKEFARTSHEAMMRPRSIHELELYMELHPCTCGSNDASRFVLSVETSETGIVRRYEGRCPGCGEIRTFEFETPELWPDLPPYAFGGSETSSIVGPGEFMLAADASEKRIAEDPASLTPDEFFLIVNEPPRAAALLDEVLKFIPPGCASVPGEAFRSDEERERARSDPKRFERATIEKRIARLGDLERSYDALIEQMDARRKRKERPPVVVFGQDAYRAHRAWLERGRTGPGRMVLTRGDLSGERIGAKIFDGARFVACNLDRADVSSSSFIEAELIDCRGWQANFVMCHLERALLESCDFTRSRFGLAELEGADIRGGYWEAASLDRCHLRGARVRGARFQHAGLHDARLDEAEFTGCDFRCAVFDWRLTDLKRVCTTRNARFIDCDFRGASFAGRRLDGTVFERCRFHGVVGKPAVEGTYTVIDPDFSESGDGSDVRTADALYALWGEPATS